MNINLRAIVFGTAVAAALTVTLNTVAAEASEPVVTLDAVTVVAHRATIAASDDVVQLEPVIVTGHRVAV